MNALLVLTDKIETLLCFDFLEVAPLTCGRQIQGEDRRIQVVLAFNFVRAVTVLAADGNPGRPFLIGLLMDTPSELLDSKLVALAAGDRLGGQFWAGSG